MPSHTGIFSMHLA